MSNQPREDLNLDQLETAFQSGKKSRLDAYSQKVGTFWTQEPKLLDEVLSRPNEEQAVKAAEERLQKMESNPQSTPDHIAIAKRLLVSAKRQLKHRQKGTKTYVEEMFGVVKERMESQSLQDRCVIEGKDTTVFDHFNAARTLVEALEEAMKQRDSSNIGARRKALENFVAGFNYEQLAKTAARDYEKVGCLDPKRSLREQLLQNGLPGPREVNPFKEGDYELERNSEIVVSESGVNLRACFGIWQLDAYEPWKKALTLEEELEALAVAENTRGKTHERVRHVTQRGRTRA